MAISVNIRAHCIIWINNRCDHYKLHVDTFFMAVHIFDAYCISQNITLQDIDAITAASFLIAAKYEESFCPRVKELLPQRNKVLDFEMKILQALDWRLPLTTISQSLRDLYQDQRAIQAHHIILYCLCKGVTTDTEGLVRICNVLHIMLPPVIKDMPAYSSVKTAGST